SAQSYNSLLSGQDIFTVPAGTEIHLHKRFSQDNSITFFEEYSIRKVRYTEERNDSIIRIDSVYTGRYKEAKDGFNTTLVFQNLIEKKDTSRISLTAFAFLETQGNQSFIKPIGTTPNQVYFMLPDTFKGLPAPVA